MAFQKGEAGSDNTLTFRGMPSENQEGSQKDHVQGVDVGRDAFQNADKAVKAVEEFHKSKSVVGVPCRNYGVGTDILPSVRRGDSGTLERTHKCAPSATPIPTPTAATLRVEPTRCQKPAGLRREAISVSRVVMIDWSETVLAWQASRFVLSMRD